MNKIGRLTTVNGGTLVDFENTVVEVLGPGYSTHPTNIVCAYTSEGDIKVEIAYSRYSVEVYRFKASNSLQHYWSRSFTHAEIVNNRKYKEVVQFLSRAYATIFS